MIIVTGAAGFIGSNLIRKLNAEGQNNIIAVDDLKDGWKIHNLTGSKIKDFYQKDEFLSIIEKNGTLFKEASVVYHLGACSSTTEWDGEYLHYNNYRYSQKLFDFSNKNKIKFIYASSASVYGLGHHGFLEIPECEKPINAYAYSKWLFDNYLRREINIKTIYAGFRFFNVYGPGEFHKGKMASVVKHFYDSARDKKTISLFGASPGYAEGEHKRDFIHVDDCVDVLLWAAKNIKQSDILNLGTGQARTFNDLAKVFTNYYDDKNININLEYIPFPEHLKKAYQNFTCADISRLRKHGYLDDFMKIEQGIPKYIDMLKEQ
jgi:ADP-L-glycero-D-manno-heptose 6-epimerase